MPKIKINIKDNTGTPYSGDETAIFIPGHIGIIEGAKGVELDPNNCLYISAESYDLAKIFNIPTLEEDKNTINYISKCLSLGFDVLYFYIEGEDVNLPSLDFLKDKNSYNIKYLTAGAAASLKATIKEETEESPSIHYEITDNGFGILSSIAKLRNDCVVLVDVDYTALKTADNYLSVNVDELAATIKEYLDENSSSSENGSLFFPNLKTSIVPFGESALEYVSVPGYMAYLAALSEAIFKNQNWLSISGVTRGGVKSLGFTPDLKLSKYNLDENLITNDNGTSLNGIVDIRGYGPTIWGDRTLLKLDVTGIKALSYLSLKVLVCDLAKRAYQTSIKCTYEPNNMVTWINFKSNLTDLLNQMVASGVLSNYTIKRGISKKFNEMVCIIHLYANLPVEDFDIYINLENAEVTMEEGGNN